MPSSRCHRPAVAVARLSGRAGRPWPQRKPWSETRSRTAPVFSATLLYSPRMPSISRKYASRHTVVALEVRLADRGLSRGRVRREHVADHVRALEVHEGQGGRGAAQPVQGEPVVEPRLHEDPPQRGGGMRERIRPRDQGLVLAGVEPREVRLHRGGRRLGLDRGACRAHAAFFRDRVHGACGRLGLLAAGTRRGGPRSSGRGRARRDASPTGRRPRRRARTRRPSPTPPWPAARRT